MIPLILAISLTQCPGGQCPPPGYPPGFGQRLFQPQPAPGGQQRFMRPPSSQIDEARKQITEEFAKLQSQLDTLEADVKALKAQPGCQCPKNNGQEQPALGGPTKQTPAEPPAKGAQGPQGPAGPQGPPGPAGQAVDEATLKQLIADALAKQPKSAMGGAQRIRIVPVPPTQQGQ